LATFQTFADITVSDTLILLLRRYGDGRFVMLDCVPNRTDIVGQTIHSRTRPRHVRERAIFRRSSSDRRPFWLFVW